MTTIILINAGISITVLAVILAMVGWAMRTARRDRPARLRDRRVRTPDRRGSQRVPAGYTPG